MRLTRVVSWVLLASSLAVTTASAQDFDPSGRRRKPPGGAGRAPKGPDAARGAKGPKDGKKKPNTDELIDRYTKALMAQPTSSFPLQKLAELYRQRDGNIDKLISDFEKRAAVASGSDVTSARLALAGVYLTARRKGDAKKLLDGVIGVRPQDPAPRLMRAQLFEQDGDNEQARRQYQAALPHVKDAAEKERVLRRLMVLSLDLKEPDEAKKHHDALVKASGGSIYVKKELGTELLSRGQHVRAEAEFRALVKEAAGDNRALAPALRDLGQALAKQKKLDEALSVLKRARQIAGQQAGIKNEILAILTEVYREQDKLPELIVLLEAETGREFGRLALIGALHEETGAVDKAMKAYREALAVDGKNVDVRIKLVHLLQAAGQLDLAITEFEALIKVAPSNTELVFELADTLIQRGERNKALALVLELERKNVNDADVLAAVADFYERIEEPDRALKVFERLGTSADSNPDHLVDLGDRYFQKGDRARAIATWKRLLTSGGERADGLVRLGEVYLEHDMQDEALASLREAVKSKPGDARVKKQLAGALEKSASVSDLSHFRYREALTLWEELLAGAADDANLARECRTHIVSVWSILHELEAKILPLTDRLGRTPPDLEAGRLLAEVQRRLNKPADAEATLRKIVAIAPGDEAALLALERVLVVQKNVAGAIDTLAKLVELNPKRAREYYQRMAQYSAELYRDEDAIEYAAKAVELSPEDAEGHYRLAAMYKRRQDNDKAMAELRKALAKNPRLHKIHFELADLALSAGELDEADRLYRQVVRTSRDEEHVIRAARLAMQLNLGRGTLASLERELLPVALGNPQKPVYRRLLVELYGAMTFPLVHAAKLGEGQAALEAQRELKAIGGRAVKPLLDALADPGALQQRTAIEVLAYVENRSAGPGLFNFAVGQADADLRVRAMIACAALEDPALLPRYEELLGGGDAARAAAGADAVTVAAVWGVARLREKKAEPLLRKLLDSAAPDVRALAAIGLALVKARGHAPALAALMRAPDANPTVRAAAAIALGELGEKNLRPALVAQSEAAEPEVVAATLVAIARIDAYAVAPGPAHADTPRTIAPDLAAILGRALTSAEPSVRGAAVAAATLAHTGTLLRKNRAASVPDARVVASEVIASFLPSGYSREAQANALLSIRDAIPRAAAHAVMVSPDRMGHIVELVGTRLGNLLLGTTDIEANTSSELAALAERIASASVPGFVALAAHPDVEVQKRALELLGQRREVEAVAAMVRALDPSQPELCLAALAALGEPRGAETIAAIVRLLAKAPSWSVRARAATALGRARAAESLTDGPTRTPDVTAALAKTARTDAFALVRESALAALATRDLAAALPVLQEAAERDLEPKVRATAKAYVERARVAPAAPPPPEQPSPEGQGSP